jgi:hypothetical protein
MWAVVCEWLASMTAPLASFSHCTTTVLPYCQHANPLSDGPSAPPTGHCILPPSSVLPLPHLPFTLHLLQPSFSLYTHLVPVVAFCHELSFHFTSRTRTTQSLIRSTIWSIEPGHRFRISTGFDWLPDLRVPDDRPGIGAPGHLFKSARVATYYNVLHYITTSSHKS